DMAGLTVLVTAGGTREPIDAVRVIANRSSGRQGHAIAEEARARGASVILVTTAEIAVSSGIECVRVETAQQMHDEVVSRWPGCDVAVMTAAVADFRPVSPAANKIKKDAGAPQIVLEPTPDILAALGAAKTPGQTLVGFAAETDDMVANAEAKLVRKNLDFIVANDVSAPGVGFSHATNAVTILGSDGSRCEIGLTDKRLVAKAVLDSVSGSRRQ
ncbi:MAG: phosphopantothenoylcysteine decarboxylase/phosphopantothenate--cysteine ligase, partial [Actinomycetota bacterium]